MYRNTLFIVLIALFLLAPLASWADCNAAGNAAGLDTAKQALQQQGNYFPSTLELFVVQSNSSGCASLTNSCRRDCCYAFFDCEAQCAPTDIPCRVDCMIQDSICADSC